MTRRRSSTLGVEGRPEPPSHRVFEADNIAADNVSQLLGYFDLPGRADNSMGAWGVRGLGTEQWFYRLKMGMGTNSQAPVLIDKNQAMGPAARDLLDPRMSWYCDYSGKQIPCGTHRGSKAVPDGGNFLFEDGHVAWWTARKIALGATSGGSGWQCYFKIPITTVAE